MSVHKYRIKRACLWNDQLWDPDEKDGTAMINPDIDGVPPHHFEPLDGGPVGDPPPKFRETRAPGTPVPQPAPEGGPAPEPSTLKGLQDTATAAELASAAGTAPEPAEMPPPTMSSPIKKK